MSQEAPTETRPVLVIHNNHIPPCGEPPSYVSSPTSQYYYGYFENENGEQWVFVYDKSTETGMLRGGDVDWAKEHPVVDGKVPSIILSQTERIWVMACWAAATEFKEVRQQERDSEK